MFLWLKDLRKEKPSLLSVLLISRDIPMSCMLRVLTAMFPMIIRMYFPILNFKAVSLEKRHWFLESF